MLHNYLAHFWFETHLTPGEISDGCHLTVLDWEQKIEIGADTIGPALIPPVKMFFEWNLQM